MAYHLAPSLSVLRDEINARWPNRDRASDGWVGDAAHQKGQSDHNPNGRGSVNALDVDKDGIDPQLVIRQAIAHPSTEYVIWNRQIWTRSSGFKAARYTGSNPHDRHLHVSVRQTRTAEQDRRPWGIAGEDDMSPEELKRADIWTNPYGDARTNPTITLDTHLRNIASNAVEANAASQAARSEVAELRAEVEALASRPTTPPVELDYARLALELLRAAAGKG